MTIQAEPEIVISDGLGPGPGTEPTTADRPPVPSAPSESHLPAATATAEATSTSTIATATATPIGTTQATIRRTALPDGSLEIQVTSTATDSADGYRHVKTEFYHVPASLAGMAASSLDGGVVPSALYLTRVEEQVVPPGGDPQPQPQPQQQQEQEQQQQIDNYFQNNQQSPSWHEDRTRKWLLCVLFAVIFGAVLVPVIAVFASRRHRSDTTTWNDDYDDDYWGSSFFDDDWYNRRNQIPIPTMSPRPSWKYTNPPWMRSYTLPPHLFAPTAEPEPTTSPRPSVDFGSLTLPPFFGAWTPSPFFDGSVAVDEVEDGGISDAAKEG
ncbi:hypothetical protein ACHAXS_001169 [Conticribra weissflogii]